MQAESLSIRIFKMQKINEKKYYHPFPDFDSQAEVDDMYDLTYY